VKLPNIKPIKSEEYQSAIAIRPKFSALDSSSFCELFNVSKSDWRSAVDNTIKKLCF
jgi:dTDP-4-dehydrorhamnose reductase